MNRLLVIDDDIELCELLADYLHPEGFEITAVHDGDEGLRKALSEGDSFSLIVLDIMLPGLSGFDILKRIRPGLETPVLMLTARDEEIDRIVGLEMGADDYLPKPFNPRELLARIRAILRRSGSREERGGEGDLRVPSPKVTVGDVEIDPGARIVRRGGEVLQLTSVEFNFLEILLKSAGSVVSREVLAEKGLGRPLSAYDRSVDVHLSSLRRKLGHKLAGTDRIKTVRGVGYIYINPSAPDDKINYGDD